MKYKILIDDTPKGLSERVQKHLDEGWELYGNPWSQSWESDNGYGYKTVEFEYCQAVILQKPIE